MNQVQKIILIDDHILLRDALASLVDKFKNCKVLARASNGKELIDLLENGFKPDIVILDLNMPVLDGYQTAEWLKANRPEIKILVLTMYDSEVALIRLLQTGVRGFLKKDIHPFDLETAIHSVAEDGYYYCNSSTGKIAAFFSKTPEGRAFFERTVLNGKEIQFLKLVSSDMTYKEIAAELKMTARSIDSYRDNMFEKLDVKSRVGLVIFAMKHGIVSF